MENANEPITLEQKFSLPDSVCFVNVIILFTM